MVFACFSAMDGFKPVATTNLETRFGKRPKDRMTRVIKQADPL